jgi:FAD/FMN-containing dehydrogenase/Fe-S oxidoreductase
VTDVEGPPGYDIPGLVSDLRAAISGRVSVEPGRRALYTSDASNYRVAPDAVVVPRTVDELAVAVTLCAERGAPVVVRGGGTSIAGNAIGGVIIDTSRHLTRILDLDPDTGLATVEPGVVLADLNRAAGAHGLVFGADPSSASRATVGGMIANNACGAHSVAWGTTADNVHALQVLLADGTPMTLDAAPSRLPDEALVDRRTALEGMPGRAGELGRALLVLVDTEAETIRSRLSPYSRRISGYALDRLLPEHGHDVARLLCGSEGTLATTLRATLRLTRTPAARSLVVLGFADAVSAADAVPTILTAQPLTVESVNAELLAALPDHVRAEARQAGLPDGAAWLLVEVPGDDMRSARVAADDLAALVAGLGVVGVSTIDDAAAQAVIWRCRRDSAGLATRGQDGREAWPGWEDAAVPPEQLGTYLRGLEALMAQYGLSGVPYGHFGEGCLHVRIDFDLASPPGIAAFSAFLDEGTDLVARLGGSVSGEHGDGRARSALLERAYGAEVVRLFRQVKDLFDPAGALNPHVLVDPRPVDADLRWAHESRVLPRVVLGYPRDAGDFAAAVRRCVGVGKCRQGTGGVMCPSYQVTREEEHSTRGRARLLQEMVDGRVLTAGWRTPELHEALDLCLSCKGCLSDCPAGVDLATYKAEFTYQYYRGRPWARPRSHWSLGWLPVWLRLASSVPSGLGTRAIAVGRSDAVRRMAGLTVERDLPDVARRRFSDLYAAGRDGTVDRFDAVLWPDTFTEHLDPGRGMAAVAVFEAAGLAVRLPRQAVCCGLTWMSTGQIGIARRVLRRSLRVIAPHLAAGRPIVGLEPSCAATLRHDGPALLPEDPLAIAASRSVRSFAESLTELAPDWRPPSVGGRALVQVHCHQHAVMGFGPDLAMLAAAGVEAVVPDSGCCGMAGHFGFEPGHVELSKAAAERVLLPAVRAASAETTILADGFSCATQIRQGTGRRPRHLAELLATGLT